jgi:hypothetical protein
MIRSLKIQHFRSHRHVHLENLGRINLLTGMNNTGKTVALEALFLLSLPGYPQIALNQLNRLRGYATISNSDLSEAWESLFYNWDKSREIVLEVEEDTSVGFGTGFDKDRQKRSLHIRPLLASDAEDFSDTLLGTQERLFDESEGVIESAELVRRTRGLVVRSISFDGQSLVQRITGSSPEVSRTQRISPDWEEDSSVAFIPARGITSLSQEAQRYSRLQIERRQGEVLELLRIIDPRLDNLVVGATRRGSAIYGDLGTNHLMPLSLMGDGMARTLSIALSMVNSQDGIVLIDEVENGLHYSVLVSLWDLIARTARRLNVQVFAATHSDECIRAVNEAVQTLGYNQDLRLYRFDLSKAGTRVIDYSSRELAAAIETEQEVR